MHVAAEVGVRGQRKVGGKKVQFVGRKEGRGSAVGRLTGPWQRIWAAAAACNKDANR